MRHTAILLVLLATALTAFAQDTNPSNTASATCTFKDGKEMSVRYNPMALGSQKDISEGQMWPASGSPMLLFTQAGFSVGNSEVPVGAYAVYVIPSKKEWTLVINKGVKAGENYDQRQDVARGSMQIGHLGQATKQVKVIFGHIAPQQCNMRVYYGKTGSWIEFKEKG